MQHTPSQPECCWLLAPWESFSTAVLHPGKPIFYSQPAEKIKVTQRMLCNFLLSSTSNSGYYHMGFLLGSLYMLFVMSSMSMLSSHLHNGKHIFYSQPAEKIKVTQRMLATSCFPAPATAATIMWVFFSDLCICFLL